MAAMSRNATATARLPLDEEVVRPTFRRERSALKRGVWPVAGCDEAGRGPLAGPVVAAAVILNPDDVPRGLDDSKRLTPERREVLYERICARAHVAVALAPPWRIDRDNILRASLWALARAVLALPVKPHLVFVDGRDRIDVACDCEAVIGGDGIVASIAAASIVAKVTRDRLMAAMARRIPATASSATRATACPNIAPRSTGSGRRCIIAARFRRWRWLTVSRLRTPTKRSPVSCLSESPAV